MALKRIPPIGKILLKEADGTPMNAEPDGSQSWAKGHSPASKFWENAMAKRRRAGLRRVREAGGKIEGASETTEDKVEFLLEVLTEFSPGVVEGIPGSMKEQIETILRDPEFGYLRDQLDTASQDWGSFLDDSATHSGSTSDNSPG